MNIEVTSDVAMRQLGERLGALCIGGEVMELVGDVGAGKTTLTKGVAIGMGINETVQSPTFTISRSYDAARQLRLVHYDFYRLTDAGIMASELAETTSDPATVTIIEWAGIVEGVLPTDCLRVVITSQTETSRQVTVSAAGPRSGRLLEALA